MPGAMHPRVPLLDGRSDGAVRVLAVRAPPLTLPQVNRMSAANLALVFAPTVGRTDAGLGRGSSENVAAELAIEIPAASFVLAAVITHRAECFPPLAATAEGALAGDAPLSPLESADSGRLGAGSEAPSSSRQPSMDEEEAPNWWYSIDGEQAGPVSAARLAAMLASGEVSTSTWVFEGGTADWQELSQVAHTRLPSVALM
jgi:hypothetical protein